MSTFLKAIVIALATSAAALPTSGNKPTSSPVASPPPASTPDTKALFQDLFSSPSATQRFQRLLVDPATGNLLSGDALRSRIVFDYNKGQTGGAGGAAAATAATFPILVDQDISTVTAFLNPCSLLVPHTHPQIESLVVTRGNLTIGNLIPGLVGPSGGTGEIVQVLSQYQGTVFPAGAIHYQLNPTCNPAIFVSSLSSSDPGTTLESTFFSLNGDVVAATLGFPDGPISGRDVGKIRNKIPQGVIIAVDQCLKKCHL